MSGAFTVLPAGVVGGPVGAGREIAIAGRLVTVGRELIKIGRALVLVRIGLILVGIRLIAIRPGLIELGVSSLVFWFALIGNAGIPFPLTPRSTDRTRAP